MSHGIDGTTQPAAGLHPVVSANTARTEPENRVFYPALDGLRALAIGMVFLWHYLGLPWMFLGVDVFFVLSGFLITGILFDTRHDRFRFRNFYVRRTLRIFPLFYLACGFVWIASLIEHRHLVLAWLAWPLYLGNFLPYLHPVVDGTAFHAAAYAQYNVGHRWWTMLYFGHFWTLCVEEQFYLLWPAVVFLVMRRRTLVWICALSIPVCLAMRIAGLHLLPVWMNADAVLYHATPFRVDSLLTGGLVALLLRSHAREAVLLWGRRLFLPLFAVAFAWAYLLPSHHHLHVYPYPWWQHTYALTATQTIAACGIVAAIQPATWVARALSLRPVRALGRISYGLYVFHDIPHPLYSRGAQFFHFDEPHAGLILGAAGTLLLATLSWRFFEAPILELKERWTVRGEANVRVAADMRA